MAMLNDFSGKAVLTVAHVAGMLDMVALPLWIGALMQHYRFSPAHAGITVTAFLLGVVATSLIVAAFFDTLPKRPTAALGFGIAAIAFACAASEPLSARSFGPLLTLHVIAGAGVGISLSLAHGCIGRSSNPHRLFSLTSVALGVFAVLFFAVVPQMIARFNASVLFKIFAASMALAAVVMAFGFPDAGASAVVAVERPALDERMVGVAWLLAASVVCLTLNQAMVFSFVERIGAARGFGADRIQGVLIALGLVNLTPGLLAALTQKKLMPIQVGIIGLIGQAVLAVTMSSAVVFGPYALAATLYVFMVIFTHSFLFGLLARLEPSGKIVAATPAMIMVGSCIGPALGGAIVQGIGYPGLGWAACAVSAIAVTCVVLAGRQLSRLAAPDVDPLLAH